MDFPYQFRPGQRELVSFIDGSVRDGLCPVVEAGTGTGKTASALAGVRPGAGDGDLKVIYLTRTKSQQAQVLRECAALGAVCVGLQGRSASSCPMMRDDPELRSGTPEEISKLCSEYKRRTEEGFACGYFANLEGVVLEEWVSFVKERRPTPEELAAECEAAGLCPYELLKRLLPSADVIAASYPFVFMPPILARHEEWTGVPLERMLVVVDEAHNLPDYLRDVQTYEYSSRAIDLVEKEAREFGDIEVQDGLKVSDVSAVLREVLAAAEREYLIEDDGIIPHGFVEEELMTRLGTTSVNISRIARGLSDYGDIIEEKRKQRKKLPRSYIGSMGRFLELWLSGPDDRSVRLVVGGDNPCFQSYCMDPAPAAEPLNDCRAAVLMSGTLEPLGEFSKELGLERAAPLRVPSPFPPGNLLTLYTDRVSMRYEERFLEENYRLLKSMIGDTVLAARVNTAVFLPSYAFMDRLLDEGLAEQLGRDVYTERRGMPQEELMEAFGRFKTSEGSVLLCVTGGRISEGLDFPDKALELAIIVGIPYPKPTAKLRAMERYYDIRFGDGRRRVVSIPAERKMRQSIGRLIRSETDRGVAVLLDRRVAAMRFDALLCTDIPAAVSAFLGGRRRFDAGRRRGQYSNIRPRNPPPHGNQSGRRRARDDRGERRRLAHLHGMHGPGARDHEGQGSEGVRHPDPHRGPHPVHLPRPGQLHGPRDDGHALRRGRHRRLPRLLHRKALLLPTGQDWGLRRSEDDVAVVVRELPGHGVPALGAVQPVALADHLGLALGAERPDASVVGVLGVELERRLRLGHHGSDVIALAELLVDLVGVLGRDLGDVDGGVGLPSHALVGALLGDDVRGGHRLPDVGDDRVDHVALLQDVGGVAGVDGGGAALVVQDERPDLRGVHGAVLGEGALAGCVLLLYGDLVAGHNEC